jgi:hypothetical protein
MPVASFIPRVRILRIALGADTYRPIARSRMKSRRSCSETSVSPVFCMSSHDSDSSFGAAEKPSVFLQIAWQLTVPLPSVQGMDDIVKAITDAGLV